MAKNLRMTPAELAAFQKRLRTAPSAIDKYVIDTLDGKDVPPPVKRPKYGNKKTAVDGIVFDSKHEAKCWQDLKLREKAGEIEHLQRQVSFPIMVNGAKVHRVVLDFWYWEWDDAYHCWEIVVADAKSEHTKNLAAWKRAKALFEAAYGIVVTVL